MEKQQQKENMEIQDLNRSGCFVDILVHPAACETSCCLSRMACHMHKRFGFTTVKRSLIVGGPVECKHITVSVPSTYTFVMYEVLICYITMHATNLIVLVNSKGKVPKLEAFNLTIHSVHVLTMCLCNDHAVFMTK